MAAPIPGAWRLGNWKRRLKGERSGVPALLIWDSVLLWTTTEGVPSWWPSGGPAAPFQPYSRNLQPDNSFLPNIPVPAAGERGLAITALACLGLSHSEFAPPRGGTNPATSQSRGKDDLTTFPWNLEDGFMKFLIWYEANYLNEDTDVIVMLPERDVRYLLQPEVAQPGGSAADAVANFKILIGRILDLFGDRLVGIYAVDEPELFGRAEYFNLETLPALRLAIREAEREWRETPGKDPDFLELTETEREAGLLPVLLTFSAEAFAIRLKIKSKDASFSFRKVREFADIFLYDEYPYKRQSSSEPSPFNLREELLAGTSLTEAEVDQVLTNSVLTTLFQDPVRVLSNFDLMRQELNEKPNRDGIFGIANPQYRHAGAWIQGNGSPFDHGTVESWSTTPAPNPGFIEGRDVDGVEVLQVAAPRGRRLPTADEIRFFT